MAQAYKVDRLNLISYRGRPRKLLHDTESRYLAKSKIINCKSESNSFKFINWRGSQFSKDKFNQTRFYGCDFIGTRFISCDFTNVSFEKCTFVACSFKTCKFRNDVFIKQSVIVNTTIPSEISIESCAVMKEYPRCEIDYDLYVALEFLRDNKPLRKSRLLFIGEQKYNHLNLKLLLDRFGAERLPKLLLCLSGNQTKRIATYQKLENVLLNQL